ncbi:glycosyltransferase family 4 protein [soil metagenome]
MRIGLVATRLSDVDGVSFEAIKWRQVLERLGHEVIGCAGQIGPENGGRLIPQMHFTHPPAARASEAAFNPASDPAAVRRDIERLADELEGLLADWLREEQPDLLIIQNAWAIPMQLPLGVALARLVGRSGIPAIGHHHDYWWERDRFATCVVPEVLAEAFPPDLPSISHVSINSLAAGELRSRRGLDSTVIPNVFDFDAQIPAELHASARALRHELGVNDGLLFMQPTRVVPRKGIELSIELVARLGADNSVLLITSPAGDEGTAYLEDLERMAERLGVDLRYLADRFRPDALVPRGPAHSLADAYLAADVITYPSLYEGFGNALIESVYFRQLVVVNRYPVYEVDIGPLGFRFIEIDGKVSDEAVEELRAALAYPDRRAGDREHNFELAQRHFSYRRLERELRGLIGANGR